MRSIPTLITFSALLAGGVRAQSVLTVRVYDYTGLSDKTLPKARSLAQHLFRKASVESEWIACPTERGEEERYPDCRKPRGEWDVILHVVPRSMEGHNVSPAAFGFALPVGDGESATHAYVFFDRVLRAARNSQRRSRPVSLETLLAYVMVHEIGHLLLGPEMHSSRGIMRPRWQAKDLHEMEIGLMQFPKEQARSLQSKLQRRAGAPR